MAGFTPAEIVEILTTIKNVLKQGGDEVQFPDGSRVRYPNREKLLAEYTYWVSLQGAADETTPPSSFVVRTTKGAD